MRVFLDGNIAGHTYCLPGAAGRRRGVSTTSADTYQPFQFADLQTTGASSRLPVYARVLVDCLPIVRPRADDDDAPWNGSVPDKLGSIELHVVHVHSQITRLAFKPKRFSGTGPVHERSKKAGAHCVE